jgi:hypothetical protein
VLVEAPAGGHGQPIRHRYIVLNEHAGDAGGVGELRQIGRIVPVALDGGADHPRMPTRDAAKCDVTERR